MEVCSSYVIVNKTVKKLNLCFLLKLLTSMLSMLYRFTSRNVNVLDFIVQKTKQLKNKQ